MGQTTVSAPIVKTWGLLAEFASATELMHAAEKVRDAGYKVWDCHSPFPIHGMDRAMGLKRSIVGYIAGFCALCGGGFGFWLQTWSSTEGYAMVIAGKPFFSFPAFIPVTFGLTIISAALGAIGGMLVLNRMPQPFHGLFYSERFKKFSDDGFFISIEASDKKFNEQTTTSFLESIGSSHVETVRGE